MAKQTPAKKKTTAAPARKSAIVLTGKGKGGKTRAAIVARAYPDAPIEYQIEGLRNLPPGIHTIDIASVRMRKGKLVLSGAVKEGDPKVKREAADDTPFGSVGQQPLVPSDYDRGFRDGINNAESNQQQLQERDPLFRFRVATDQLGGLDQHIARVREELSRMERQREGLVAVQEGARTELRRLTS